MDVQFGICVRTSFYYDAQGRTRLKAIHKRDKSSSWTVYTKGYVGSSLTDHESVLALWIDKFTASDKYFVATFKVVARGTDCEGYYFILAPVS